MVRPIRAGTECVKNCPNLKGCVVQDVELVLDEYEEPSGWVVLSNETGRESVLLPDRGDENETYLTDVQGCPQPERHGRLLVKYECIALDME